MSFQPLRIAFVLATLAPLAAFAAPTQQTTAQVFFGDLNLRSESGRAALMARVGQAADKVCSGPVLSVDVHEKQEFRACRSAALASVKPRLDAVVEAAETNSSKLAQLEVMR